MSDRRRKTRTRRGSATRALVFAIGAGAVLGMAALVAFSCQSARRSIPLESASRNRAAEAPLSISPAESASLRDEPLVRVRVKRGVERVSLSRAGPWVVAASGAHSGEVVNGPVRVMTAGGAIQLMSRTGRVTGFPAGVTVFAAPHSAAGGRGTVTVGETDYPGTLRLVPSDDTATFDVINVVGIEDYLPGVVAKELIPGWHESAFRVQAVAARTFALQRREAARRSGRHFDLESTTTDQVYGGTTGLAVAHSAVEATRGIVLIDGASLGNAYYSSTCGGRPALPEEIWPSSNARIERVAITYIGADSAGQAKRDILCQESPLFRWSAVRRTSELVERLNAWGVANRDSSLASLTSLSEIRAIESGESGRPIRFAIIDRRGAVTELTAERLRIACNASADGLEDVARPSRVHSNDMAFDVGKRVTRIEGRGFGHGVGMCQFCSQGMARRGDHWRRILESFYPDYDLRRVY